MTSPPASSIWIHFQIAQDENYANCNLCLAKISRGKGSHTTSAMWKHLKAKHLSKFQELKGTRSPSPVLPPASPSTSSPLSVSADLASEDNNDPAPDEVASVESPASMCSPAPSPGPAESSFTQSPFKLPPVKRKIVPPPSNQWTMAAFLDKTQSFKPGDKRAKTVTRLVAEMICKANQPLSIVEDRGFRKLLNHLEPRYVIPSRKHLAEKVIPQMYEEVKTKVEDLLGKNNFIGLTTDMWTSTSCDDYLSLTVHFLDENFQYHHLCLECIPFPEVSHTASAIETFITTTLKDWNLSQKVVCVMRDNGPNVVAALQRSPFHHLPCLAHTFQLVLKDGLLNKTEIKDIMSSCLSIVGHYKHSSKAMKTLRSAQAKLNTKPRRLIQDEPTRWNSQLHMLARLMEQKQAVLLSASDLNFQVDLTARQWTVIEEVIRILDVFDKATFVASSSQVTISEIIPLVNSTIRALQTFKSSVGSVQGFRNDLLASMRRRYHSVESEKFYALATLLDPRFKGNVFFNRENLDAAKSTLAIEITDLSMQVEDADLCTSTQGLVRDTSQTSTEQQGGHSMWSYYSQLMVPSSNSSEQSCRLSPEEEINAYLAEPLLQPSSDIFKYWKENKKYQNLRKLSKKFLITPPSTVISERLFSTSGNIVDRKRSRLDPERVRMLVFLNKNLP
ncbi:zinc finger BED domain-containing protein 4-like [Hyperolius riggenbachi]|uniref:zinc finger BED domain-containing protein 4-like n=1 Tax=Hyperolius riggenbachi TaxID=752182 RepID=UPI0035A373F5